MNTTFQKPSALLYTYREHGTAADSSLTRGNYETLDYVISPHRWRNNIRDINVDTEVNISTDHYPLIATIQVRLKSLHTAYRQPRK
eukprot:9946123-Prorocentrum_lima.AAC.1